MNKLIGAREISEYAQKYNMPLRKDTPLSMAWCFDMADKAYEKGRADAIDEVIEIAREEIDFDCELEQTRFMKFMENLKEQKE